MEIATVQVNRWRRYGKDRLYVESSAGARIGYWDLQSDEPHPESPPALPALAEAVEAWRAVQADPVDVNRAEPAQVPADRTVPVASRPWVDLCSNKAGAEAREQAVAARDEAPLATLVARAVGVHTKERAWRIGADGESKVARQLEKAAKKDPRWRFIHAIPVGVRGSDIDHLIVGPGGVFTVNTKHHPKAKIWVSGGTFLVDGHPQPYIRNSRYEAARAARLLGAVCGFPVHVEGLVVTVNADDVVVKTPTRDVHVVPRMQIANWVLRHGDVLSQDELEVIFAAARRSTTWVSDR